MLALVKENRVGKHNTPAFRAELAVGSVRDVYETLRRLATGKFVCKANLPVLASRSGYCQRTVQRALRTLESLGYIRIERCINKNNRCYNIYYFISLK